MNDLKQNKQVNDKEIDRQMPWDQKMEDEKGCGTIH